MMIYITGKKEAVDYINSKNINLVSSRLKLENYNIHFDVEDSCVKISFPDRDAEPSLYDYGGDYEKLCEFIRGITDLITGMGFVNMDFQDIEAILKDAGTVSFATGIADGEYRAEKAARSALAKLKMKPESIKNILLNITTGAEITLTEMAETAFMIEEIAEPDTQVIWGHVIDESVGESVKVTLIVSSRS